METIKSVDLSKFEAFITHPWVDELVQKYHRDSVLAKNATVKLVKDLEELNREWFDKTGRVAFTTINSRVKRQDSFLRKVYKYCCESSRIEGFDHSKLTNCYSHVYDLTGCRVSCPYYDEIIDRVNGLIRPKLAERGYATKLQQQSEFIDKNFLNDGDDKGYRSYHFFIKIPTTTDIFGNIELCLCEMQARSELQHVWAVKSHDLLYKQNRGWIPSDNHIVEDMRQLSNSLRAADQYLISIRDRVRGGNN